MESNDTLRQRPKKQAVRRELSSADAIRVAKAAFNKRGFVFGSKPGKLEAEFMELGLLTSGERNSAVDDALSQINSENRLGPQPPNNISVPPYAGKTLYAFVWKSKDLGSIYLKFCLAGATETELLILHSFHREREKENDQ